MSEENPKASLSRRGPGRWLLAIAAIALVAIAVFVFTAAWNAGRVPGQPEATRVPITPFADIPGFAPPTPAP
jgi:hypothetical protein